MVHYSKFWQAHLKTVKQYGFRSRTTKNQLRFYRDVARAYAVQVASKWTAWTGSGKMKDARGLHFLWKKGLIKEYLQTLEKFNSSNIVAAAQNFWFYDVLRRADDKFKLFKDSKDLNFLEIGSGGGLFALYMFEKYPIKNYILVDLPEMLEVAKAEFKRVRPDLLSKVQFLKPDETGQLADKRFDGFFNFCSFTEMEQPEIKRYFDLIYKTAKPGAVFYNVNYDRFLENRDGTITDNSSIFFPYSPNDKILVWNISEWHNIAKSTLAGATPFALLRIAKINQS